MLTNKDVKKILNYPSRVTLNLVLDLVNLKDKELKAITLMDIKGNTREETAEMMNISCQAVSKIRNKAFKKMIKVWSNDEIIEEILNAK